MSPERDDAPPIALSPSGIEALARFLRTSAGPQVALTPMGTGEGADLPVGRSHHLLLVTRVTDPGGPGREDVN